jgi:hypothetical protein
MLKSIQSLKVPAKLTDASSKGLPPYFDSSSAHLFHLYGGMCEALLCEDPVVIAALQKCLWDVGIALELYAAK